MKKSFLLVLLALFPLFSLAGSISVTLTKTEGSTADADITFSDLVSVITSDEGTSWYGWTEGSDFTYYAYKLVDGQFSEQASFSGSGAAIAPNSDGLYLIKVSREYITKELHAGPNGQTPPPGPRDKADGVWDVGVYNVTTPANTNNQGGIDLEEIVGNLQVNALSQKKYWGQEDPAPRFNITNGWNRIISSQAIGLDESTISMFRASGEEPGAYAWNVDVSEAQYNVSPDYQLVSGTGDFLVIKKVPVNEATGLITIAQIPDQAYTGEEIEPGVTITYHAAEQFGGDIVLVENTDYTLAYEGNVEPGQATVTITGTGSYFENVTTTTFNIVAAVVDPNDITVVVDPVRYTYTGEEIEPESIKVLYKDTELTEEEDYTIDYADADKVNAGEVPFVVHLEGRYSGDKEASYFIDPVDVATLDITVESPKTYTSQEIKPAVTVKFGDVELNVDGAEDYTVEYANNIYAGEEAQAIIKGVEGGNFSGETTVNFTIKKRNLRDTGDPELKPIIWTGAEQQVEIKKWGFYGKQIPTLLEKDLIVTYKYISGEEPEDVAAITNAGAYEVTFTAAEDEPNFTGSKTFTIEVAKASFTAKVADVTAGFDTDWTVKYEVVPADDLDDATKAAIIAAVERGGKDRFSLDRPVTGIGEYTISYNTGIFESEELDPNFELVVEDGILTITKATLKLIVNAAEINYGQAAPTRFTFEVESGLPEGETFRTRLLSEAPVFVIDGEKDARGLYPVKRDADDNVTSYEVSVQQTNLVYDENYNVIVKPGTLTVNPLEIPNSGIQNYFRWTLTAENLPYNGKPQVPEMTVTYNVSSVGTITLDPETEYEVTATNNQNASTLTSPAVVRITGKGNFTGYRETTFQITRVPLTVKAVETTVAYNKLAETVFAFEVEGLMPADEDVTEEYPQDDIDNLLGASGKVVVNNTSTTTVGLHPDALVPSGLGNPRNYNVTYVPADLIVTAPEAFVKLIAEEYTKVYGDPDPEFDWTYDSGLLADEEVAWESLITGTPVYKVVDAEGNEVDYTHVGTYNVIVEGLTATNYTVKSNVATLTVEPRPISVKPEEQTIPYGTTAIDENAFEITEGNLAYNDTKADLSIKVVLDESKTAIGENKNALTIDVTGANENYDITVLPYDDENQGATVIIEPGDIEFVLHRVNKADFEDPEKNDAAKLIKDFNGQVVETVSINHNDDPATEFIMIPDKWYTLVLPFETNMMDLIQAFQQYVVVNTLNQANTKENRISFKTLLGNVPANTPFVIKVSEEIDLNTVTFSNKTIVAPEIEEGEESFYVKDASGVKFYGSYTGKIGFAANEYFFTTSTREDTWNNYYNGSATNTTYMRPVSAYLWTADAPGSAARMITFEEPDGTITTIMPMNADNVTVNVDGWYTINGVKLDTVPTTKGIYINNGKKVVIK